MENNGQREMCSHMSTHYQKLLTCFEKWADDSACFLINETFCDPSFILQDDCFNSLNEPISKQMHIMSKECME